MKRLIPLAFIAIISCNESSAPVPQNTDTIAETKKDTTPEFKYDPSFDGALISPASTKILGDTLGIKMYEIELKPGDSARLHRHPDHAVYVLQGGKLAVYFDGTNRVEIDMPTGGSITNGPVADAAKNIGKTTIKLLIVDLYRPRGK